MPTLSQDAAIRIHSAVAAHLALDEVALRERVRQLEADVEAYRTALQVALDHLHEFSGREQVRVRRVRRLLDELARLRATPRGRVA